MYLTSGKKTRPQCQGEAEARSLLHVCLLPSLDQKHSLRATFHAVDNTPRVLLMQGLNPAHSMPREACPNVVTLRRAI